MKSNIEVTNNGKSFKQKVEAALGKSISEQDVAIEESEYVNNHVEAVSVEAFTRLAKGLMEHREKNIEVITDENGETILRQKAPKRTYRRS